MKAASEREVSGRVSWLRDVAGQQVPTSPLTTQGFSHVFARCMAGIEPAPSNFTYQLSGHASVSGILLDLDIQMCCFPAARHDPRMIRYDPTWPEHVGADWLLLPPDLRAAAHSRPLTLIPRKACSMPDI